MIHFRHMHPNEEPFLVGLVAHWDFRSRSNGNCFPPSHQCRLYRITHDWYGHHFRAVIGIRRHFGSMIGVCRWDAGLFLIARWIGRQNIVLLLASTEPPTQMCDFSTYTISYDAYGGSDSSVGNKKNSTIIARGREKSPVLWTMPGSERTIWSVRVLICIGLSSVER